MLFLVVLAGALLTIRPARGRFHRLAIMSVRSAWLVAAALMVQIIAISLLRHPPQLLAGGLHLASYGLAALFLWHNRHLAGLPLLAAGGAANLVAIAVNRGTMPARPSALHLAGIHQDPGHFANSTVLVDPHLPWLGDIFAVPHWAGFLANVFSLGDLALAGGAVWLLHAAAGCHWTRPGRTPIPDDRMTAPGGALLPRAARSGEGSRSSGPNIRTDSLLGHCLVERPGTTRWAARRTRSPE